MHRATLATSLIALLSLGCGCGRDGEIPVSAVDAVPTETPAATALLEAEIGSLKRQAHDDHDKMVNALARVTTQCRDLQSVNCSLQARLAKIETERRESWDQLTKVSDDLRRIRSERDQLANNLMASRGEVASLREKRVRDMGEGLQRLISAVSSASAAIVRSEPDAPQPETQRTATTRRAETEVSAPPSDSQSLLREAVNEWAADRGCGGYRLWRLDAGDGLGQALRRATATGGYNSFYTSGEGNRRLFVRLWVDHSSRTVFYKASPT